MKVYIESDELYPFFILTKCQEGNEAGVPVIELPIDKVKWVEETMKEFWEVQKFLHDNSLVKFEYVL